MGGGIRSKKCCGKNRQSVRGPVVLKNWSSRFGQVQSGVRKAKKVFVFIKIMASCSCFMAGLKLQSAARHVSLKSNLEDEG